MTATTALSVEQPQPEVAAESIGQPSRNNGEASAVVIACSAVLREVLAVTRANDWSHIETKTITSELHNRPEKIPDAVKELIDEAKQKGQQIFVAYGDCGTGGRLDALLEQEGVERIPGAHCYEFYSGREQFSQFHEAELGTFYLTDFLVRHFDRLVIRGLGLDRKPELLPLYFGHYTKLLYIAQSVDPALQEQAKAAAEQLGLAYEHYQGGSGDMGPALHDFNRRIAVELK